MVDLDDRINQMHTMRANMKHFLQFTNACAVLLFATPAFTAESLLDSTLNTRDLGGYLTDDGRVVRKKMLYRSDSLADLSSEDINTLRAFNLAAVTDLRSAAERHEAPYQLPDQQPPISYRTIAINNPAIDIPSLRERVFSGKLTSAELDGLLSRESYIVQQGLREAWGDWLGSLTDDGQLPHLFHCTAGKDRTGFAAAILLLTLGVSIEQVTDDFLLSNELLADRIERVVSSVTQTNPDTDAAGMRALVGVSHTSLLSALDAMKAHFGSVDRYIETGLGIDKQSRQRLRELLLANPLEAGKRLTDAHILDAFHNVRDDARVADAAGTAATNFWHGDGTFESNWSNGEASGVVTGTWAVRDNMRCVTIASGSESQEQQRCGPIYEFEGNYFSTNADGTLHGMHRVTPLAE